MKIKLKNLLDKSSTALFINNFNRKKKNKKKKNKILSVNKNIIITQNRSTA